QLYSEQTTRTSRSTVHKNCAIPKSLCSNSFFIQNHETMESAPRQSEMSFAKKQAAPCQEDGGADVSGLDLRVGRIITAVQLPDTDSLYMEQVDVGEASPRMVVSKLSKHVSVDQVQNRMVVLLCNLKPAMTKGFVSQAVLLCARSSDKVEILDPPSGAVPGDRVTSQQFSGEPDKGSTLEKMAWEHIQPDLCTDAQCVATYKGDALEVKGKGVCTVQTMKNSQIE
uniref:Aminoacyl tRNA synthetase complex interacting multifunctional protein 1a n=1 Tax=Salarias fasciatus TaxID=181472 RepID=A0A672I672_SALFA